MDAVRAATAAARAWSAVTAFGADSNTPCTDGVGSGRYDSSPWIRMPTAAALRSRPSGGEPRVRVAAAPASAVNSPPRAPLSVALARNSETGPWTSAFTVRYRTGFRQAGRRVADVRQAGAGTDVGAHLLGDARFAALAGDDRAPRETGGLCGEPGW